MMPPLASLSQLEARTEVSDPDRATAVLEDISAAIRTFSGKDFMTDADPPVLGTVPDGIQMVTLQIAMRIYGNPTGIASEQIGQYSYRIGAGAGPGIYISKQERDLIALASGGSRLHTIPLYAPGLRSRTVYFETTDGGEPIPYEEWP